MSDSSPNTPDRFKIDKEFKWKKHEAEILADVQEYLKATYTQHYAGGNGVQVVDMWEACGSLDTTARDMAMKYLARFGKKEGRNKADLFKALHFIMMMIDYCERTNSFDHRTSQRYGPPI